MMDWQTERQQEAKTISELAQAVAKAMGWSYDRPKADQEEYRSRYILSPDKMQRISIGLVWNKKDRVTISGDFHAFGLHSFLPYKAENPDITVAIARGAEVIAKEITRRVLPGYTELMQQAQERKNQADAYQAKIENNAAELLAVLASEAGVRQSCKSDTFYFNAGEIRISSDSASLKLDLSIEQAKAVLQLIKGGN